MRRAKRIGSWSHIAKCIVCVTDYHTIGSYDLGYIVIGIVRICIGQWLSLISCSRRYRSAILVIGKGSNHAGTVGDTCCIAVTVISNAYDISNTVRQACKLSVTWIGIGLRITQSIRCRRKITIRIVSKCQRSGSAKSHGCHLTCTRVGFTSRNTFGVRSPCQVVIGIV